MENELVAPGEMAFRKLLTALKAALVKEEAKGKRAREKTREAKKPY